MLILNAVIVILQIISLKTKISDEIGYNEESSVVYKIE